MAGLSLGVATSFFIGEGFDDGLSNGGRGISVLSVQLASFPSKPVCLFISLQCARIHWAARSNRAISTWLRSFWWGFWSLLRTERASVKMTTLGLVQGGLSLISVAAFLRASASALKLVEYFSVAQVVLGLFD